MIYGVILGIHVIVCVCLVLVVLLQSSKGGGLAGGSAFGGGADSTVFGGRGAATVLSKATTVFGAAFMLTSLTLTLIGGTRSTGARSVLEEQATQAPFGAPAQTAPPTGTLPGTEGAVDLGVPAGPQLPPAQEAGGEADAPAEGTPPSPAEGE